MDCVHGQVECQKQQAALNIMVAIGEAEGITTNNVEVINTQTIESCINVVEPLPNWLEQSVALKNKDQVVICGGRNRGYTFERDCYSYDHVNNKWDLEPFQLLPMRTNAKSVEIRPDEWLIVGGTDPSYDPLSDSQLFKDGQFFPGPNLPMPMDGRAAVMLDERRLFVTGGMYTKKNFLLDIETDEWTEIAERIYEESSGGNCGTFYNSTADEIQIAHIGYYGIEVYSPRTDSWQVGFPLPFGVQRIYVTETVQQGRNSFVLIGGLYNWDTMRYNGDIHHFDEAGLKIIKKDVLIEARRWHVAIDVPEEQFKCNKS